MKTLIRAIDAIVAFFWGAPTVVHANTLAGRESRAVFIKTANYTVVADTDNGKSFSTEGAGGTVVFALPAATVGQWYRFYVGAAQELRIDPNGTETIALPSTGAQGAAGKYLSADAIGENVEIQCLKAGTWTVNRYIGTWTAES